MHACVTLPPAIVNSEVPMNQTAPPTVQDWRARAAVLPINGQAFIDGRYVDAASGATFDDVTPIDGRVIARVASTDQAPLSNARRASANACCSASPS
jgi:4-guanidinobutyraldehyde dehydrogenase / NAD-dependent aldehyde dehydrogenase